MACYGRHGGMRYVITLYPNPYLGCLNCGVVWYVLLLVRELQLTQKTRDIAQRLFNMSLVCWERMYLIAVTKSDVGYTFTSWVYF